MAIFRELRPALSWHVSLSALQCDPVTTRPSLKPCDLSHGAIGGVGRAAQTAKECRSSVEGSSDAIFQHADAVQHLVWITPPVPVKAGSICARMVGRASMLHVQSRRCS